MSQDLTPTSPQEERPGALEGKVKVAWAPCGRGAPVPISPAGHLQSYRTTSLPRRDREFGEHRCWNLFLAEIPVRTYRILGKGGGSFPTPAPCVRRKQSKPEHCPHASSVILPRPQPPGLEKTDRRRREGEAAPGWRDSGEPGRKLTFQPALSLWKGPESKQVCQGAIPSMQVGPRQKEREESQERAPLRGPSSTAVLCSREVTVCAELKGSWFASWLKRPGCWVPWGSLQLCRIRRAEFKS